MIAERLRNRNINILLIRYTLYLLGLFSATKEGRRLNATTALKVMDIVKPRIMINGYTRIGGYEMHIFPQGTLYIYISSNRKEKHYVVLYIENKEIEV